MPIQGQEKSLYLETRLVQVSVVCGFYAFEAFYYYLLMIEVARYLYHKGYTKKRKPQIEGWFLNVLHILGQEKILFLVNKITRGY